MSSYIKFMFNYLFQGSGARASEIGELELQQEPAAHELAPHSGNPIGGAELSRGQLASWTLAGAGHASPVIQSARADCSPLVRVFARHAHARAAASGQPVPLVPVRSFGELGAWLRQQQQQQQHQVGANASDSVWRQPLLGERAHSGQEAERQAALLDCFNQAQVHDYYAGYDILVGLRIATSLTLLFVVFILFVVYKTGCRDKRARRLARAQPAKSVQPQPQPVQSQPQLVQPPQPPQPPQPQPQPQPSQQPPQQQPPACALSSGSPVAGRAGAHSLGPAQPPN